MSDAKVKLCQIVPVFAVADVRASVAFFTGVLGWQPRFVWPPESSGEPARYGGVHLDDVAIHLNAYDDTRAGNGEAYVFIVGVDAYYRDVVARGGKPECEPTNQAYGIRDFTIRDLDGNCITFGENIEEGA